MLKEGGDGEPWTTDMDVQHRSTIYRSPSRSSFSGICRSAASFRQWLKSSALSQAHAAIIQNTQRALFSVFPLPSCRNKTHAILQLLNSCNSCNFLSLCYFPDRALLSNYFLMEIDFQAIQTDELKSRIGELRRYL
jgi:hypothetical protein